MSKAEARIITVEQAPILTELGLPELIKDYKAVYTHEIFHKTKMEFYGKKRDAVKESIRIAIVAANADTVVYTDSKGLEWRSTIVEPETPKVLDPQLLAMNIMKIGKLPSPVAQQIIAKSTVDGTKRKAYVKVTVPVEGKK